MTNGSDPNGITKIKQEGFDTFKTVKSKRNIINKGDIYVRKFYLLQPH